MTERYEEIRRKLVERGYLHGPLERFLLRDLAAGGGRGGWRTSLEAALIGAPLLGGLLAASTVAANRPALGARDALVLWLYFAVLTGVALLVLDLAAAALASAWAQRRGARRSDALRAGLLVAVPVLAYLVLAWARGRPEGGFGSDALFLAGAVGATALVAWLAGIVSLARIVGKTGEVPDRNRRPALLVLAVLVPIAAAFFLVPHGGASDRAIPASPFVIPPTLARVVMIGVDGLDGGLVESAGDRGALDHLLSLFASGALFPKHRDPALAPPEVWTTILTGVGAEEHGVRAVGGRALPGVAGPIAERTGPAALEAALRFLLPSRTVPASGAGRRVRTLWEIAGLARPSSSVGWWASWPARGTAGDPERGYVVSDRVLAKLLSEAAEDRDTAPASLFTRLSRDFPAERAELRGDFDRSFAAVPGELLALAWESFLIDAFAWRTHLGLLDDPEVGSAFVYLPGLDILRTRAAGRPGAEVTIEAYLRWLDGAVFARAGADRMVLVADPGRSAGPGAEGFVAVVGGGAAPACVGPPIGDLDVAPVALRMLGLPVSREMRGAPPARCLERADPAAPAIATWGRRGRPEDEGSSDYDPEMVERLKSLGYLR
ncbi:MAG TPA: hypothetical protein VFB67_09765 [Candidatus Polarisedimenticolaceae bacterium]|nr:hypothetical protein [Candidatus Polarisedimenticolaceae bacterium]